MKSLPDPKDLWNPKPMFSQLGDWKMYIITRRDLSKSVQTVQSCHAVAELMLFLEDYHDRWLNGHMVVLGAENEAHLYELRDRLLEAKIKDIDVFSEEDIGFTSMACLLHKDQYKIFSDLKLL